MKNIRKRLKYIEYKFNSAQKTLTITTYSKDGPGQSFIDSDTGTLLYKTGEITLNKTYLFSLVRFTLSLLQRNFYGKRKANS